jgi:RNA polymerase sigma-70 factor (ECF subfamily)
MDDRRRRFEAQALPHQDAAYNLARWLARSAADAEDIVQDAMLRAFRSFDGFRGGDAKPWLLTIVRNCWRDKNAAERRHGHMPLPENENDLPPSEAADPETVAISSGDSRQLNAMLWRLPPEFREVLILREMEDMSYRDIAAVTGVPIGTVMSRLARSRALLRAKWELENA